MITSSLGRSRPSLATSSVAGINKRQAVGQLDAQTNDMDEFHALEDFTKDNVLSIQPRGLYGGNEL